MSVSGAANRDGCLSVIIPTHNSADTLGAQLDALLEQAYSGAWEVVVVDNHSTDATTRLVQVYKQRMPHLRLVEAREKRSIPYARNVGLEAARGDRLLFCDADDVVDRGWLAAMARALDEHDFVAGRIDYTKLNPLWAQHTLSRPQRHGLQRFNYPPFLAYSATCNLGFKRWVYAATGPFDETFAFLSDIDFCWRAQLAGARLHFVPEALVHYRFRTTLLTLAKRTKKYGVYSVLLYRKYREHGMPPIEWKDSLRSWLTLIHELPHVRSRSRLRSWLLRLIWRIGRLQGSVKYRVFAL